MSATEALLKVRDLTVDYPLPRRGFARRQLHRAVDGVGFDIAPQETLGLVGESGSGKTTIARAVLGLVRPTRGTISFDGVDLTAAPAEQVHELRPDMQVVFQNPFASLNPALTVGDAVGEPLYVHRRLRGAALQEAVHGLLRQVGLDPSLAGRFPRSFSGGQRQRIAVARAIALGPRLLIADEPVSSLDVSTRGQIVNLLADLRHQLGLASLFIGHDLAVVRHVSDRIAVLYRGQIVEVGPAEEVADAPRHPYTQHLVASVPVPDPAVQASRRALRSVRPSNGVADSGCPFAPRCPHRMERCEVEAPEARVVGPVVVRCHLHDEAIASSEPAPEVAVMTATSGAGSKLSVVSSAAEAGELVAQRILDRLATTDGDREFHLACPAGRTPLTTYEALGGLAARRGADLSRVVITMLDEYLVAGPDGLSMCDATSHFSCRRYARDHLLRLVNRSLPPGRRLQPERVRVPDPVDPAAFDAALAAAGGIDFIILASGSSDGHVAFNPPGTEPDAPSRVVTLAESTRRDNLATFPGFGSLDDVPRHGVTLGLAAMTRAREAVLVLLGESKTEAFDRVVRCRTYDPAWPATVIHECRNARLVADRAAAGRGMPQQDQ